MVSLDRDAGDLAMHATTRIFLQQIYINLVPAVSIVSNFSFPFIHNAFLYHPNVFVFVLSPQEHLQTATTNFTQGVTTSTRFPVKKNPFSCHHSIASSSSVQPYGPVGNRIFVCRLGKVSSDPRLETLVITKAEAFRTLRLFILLSFVQPPFHASFHSTR